MKELQSKLGWNYDDQNMLLNGERHTHIQGIRLFTIVSVFPVCFDFCFVLLLVSFLFLSNGMVVFSSGFVFLPSIRIKNET